MKPVYLSEKPFMEPTKEVFIIVKGPQGEEFTIRQWREGINKTIRYEILDRKMEVAVGNLEFQEEEIKNQLRWENPLIEDWIIEEFINILNAILKEEYDFLKERLESDYDLEVTEPKMISYESDHPLIFYLEIPEFMKKRIFYCIEKLLPEYEGYLKNFLENHNKEDDVMLIKVIWKFLKK